MPITIHPDPRDESEAWLELGRQLGFRVVAPYAFAVGGARFACVAMLPDFGSPRGMLVRVGPESSAFMAAATAAGFGYSHLSIIDCHPDSLADVLSAWGWSGPPDARPGWLAAAPVDDGLEEP